MWSNNGWEFPQIKVRCQTTDQGNSENITKINVQKKNQNKTKTLHLGISYSTFRRSKTKEKISKETRGEKTPCL